MRNALNMLYNFSAALAACALVMIAVIVFTQVSFNIIDAGIAAVSGKSLGLLIPSYSLFSGYALGWATFLSLGLGFRRAVHIRVTLIEGRLPRVPRLITLTLVSIIGAVTATVIAWNFAHLTWESWVWGDRASGLVKLPLWVPQAGMCFGLIVFVIACLDTLIEMLRYGRSDALKEDTTIEDAIHG